jgi:hypothetical protein
MVEQGALTLQKMEARVSYSSVSNQHVAGQGGQQRVLLSTGHVAGVVILYK